MTLSTLVEWVAGLALVQTLLVFLPHASAPAVLARYLLWFAMGVGFLYWVGQGGLDVGRLIGSALRASG